MLTTRLTRATDADSLALTSGLTLELTMIRLAPLMRDDRAYGSSDSLAPLMLIHLRPPADWLELTETDRLALARSGLPELTDAD